MIKGGNEITKEEFQAYKKVQDSGMYNMFTPDAARAAGLDKETFLVIIKNYSELKEKFENEENKEED